MINVAQHVYSISFVGERLGTRRAGSNFPGASWKDFRAPTRVGEAKVQGVNRVATVGVTQSPRNRYRIYRGGPRGAVCSPSFSMGVNVACSVAAR